MYISWVFNTQWLCYTFDLFCIPMIIAGECPLPKGTIFKLSNTTSNFRDKILVYTQQVTEIAVKSTGWEIIEDIKAHYLNKEVLDNTQNYVTKNVMFSFFLPMSVATFSNTDKSSLKNK